MFLTTTAGSQLAAIKQPKAPFTFGFKIRQKVDIRDISVFSFKKWTLETYQCLHLCLCLHHFRCQICLVQAS